LKNKNKQYMVDQKMIRLFSMNTTEMYVEASASLNFIDEALTVEQNEDAQTTLELLREDQQHELNSLQTTLNIEEQN